VTVPQIVLKAEFVGNRANVSLAVTPLAGIEGKGEGSSADARLPRFCDDSL
jgi:hypothetical protein